MKKGKKDRFCCGNCGNVFEAACPECGTVLTRRQLVLGDFLTGAHALVHADCLLFRDLGVYNKLFS